jgi:hypothetical protein
MAIDKQKCFKLNFNYAGWKKRIHKEGIGIRG